MTKNLTTVNPVGPSFFEEPGPYPLLHIEATQEWQEIRLDWDQKFFKISNLEKIRKCRISKPTWGLW